MPNTLISIVTLGILLSAPTVSASPPEWIHGGISEGLKLSQGKRSLIVQVSAPWCSPCNQLEREILSTRSGLASVLQDSVGVRISFDSEAGQAATRKYGILAIPTTIILDPKGAELGRVEGYPGRDQYLQALRDVRRGKRTLAILEKRAKAKPDDWDRQIDWAQALLARNKESDARRILEGAMSVGGPVGGRATRVWGRWLLRVQGKGDQAATHFLRAIESGLYQGTPDENGFRYWAAKAHHVDKQSEKALAIFERWAKAIDDPKTPLLYLADFLVQHVDHYGTKAAEQAIRTALSLNPKEGWLHYLLAKTLRARGDTADARTAIDKAITLQPKKAIYRNFSEASP
jgi:tetratricopeptide (TPR) repeat protein